MSELPQERLSHHSKDETWPTKNFSQEVVLPASLARFTPKRAPPGLFSMYLPELHGSDGFMRLVDHSLMKTSMLLITPFEELRRADYNFTINTQIQAKELLQFNLIAWAICMVNKRVFITYQFTFLNFLIGAPPLQHPHIITILKLYIEHCLYLKGSQSINSQLSTYMEKF